MQFNKHLASECLALACFARYTYDGESVIAGAFDAYSEDVDPLGTSKHYHFGIHVRDKALVLMVDAYTATNESVKFTAETFDDDAWNDQLIEVTAEPISKEAFRTLSSVGRALLNGRGVVMEDGTVIPAIVRN